MCVIKVLNSDSLYRQADKNGDGKLSLEEIIDIFKVSLLSHIKAVFMTTSPED